MHRRNAHTTFGDGGIDTKDIAGGEDLAEDLVAQGDGKIVAPGFAANGLDTEVALTRILP